MSTNGTEDAELAKQLRALVLRAYADGTTTEGTWTIESVPDEIPDWEVTISRVDEVSNGEPSDSPADT